MADFINLAFSKVTYWVRYSIIMVQYSIAVRSDKTKGTFKFLQLPMNTNDATTGHKLQGMSKDRLIVTSWDGISKWSNWAYTVLSRVRKLEGLFLCKPLHSSVSDHLRDYERFMVEKEQNMMEERERERKLKLEDRNALFVGSFLSEPIISLRNIVWVQHRGCYCK